MLPSEMHRWREQGCAKHAEHALFARDRLCVCLRAQSARPEQQETLGGGAASGEDTWYLPCHRIVLGAI